MEFEYIRLVNTSNSGTLEEINDAIAYAVNYLMEKKNVLQELLQERQRSAAIRVFYNNNVLAYEKQRFAYLDLAKRYVALTKSENAKHFKKFKSMYQRILSKNTKIASEEGTPVPSIRDWYIPEPFYRPERLEMPVFKYTPVELKLNRLLKRNEFHLTYKRAKKHLDQLLCEIQRGGSDFNYEKMVMFAKRTNETNLKCVFDLYSEDIEYIWEKPYEEYRACIRSKLSEYHLKTNTSQTDLSRGVQLYSGLGGVCKGNSLKRGVTFKREVSVHVLDSSVSTKKPLVK